MWVSRKKWSELVQRVDELERATGMTSFPEGYIGHWDKPALHINKVVEQIAERMRLRRLSKREERFYIEESEK
jgi:hypothetical protein